jgi:hypothetical protein
MQESGAAIRYLLCNIFYNNVSLYTGLRTKLFTVLKIIFQETLAVGSPAWYGQEQYWEEEEWSYSQHYGNFLSEYSCIAEVLPYNLIIHILRTKIDEKIHEL